MKNARWFECASLSHSFWLQDGTPAAEYNIVGIYFDQKRRSKDGFFFVFMLYNNTYCVYSSRKFIVSLNNDFKIELQG